MADLGCSCTSKEPNNNFYESDKPPKPISFLNNNGINTTLPRKIYKPSKIQSNKGTSMK
jgi:hypothetical protein